MAGNFIIDRVAMLDRYPAEGTLATILSSTSSTPTNGGPAYNALVDLARLRTDVPLAALGLVGDDVDGRHIVAHCRSLGIDTRQLRRIPGAATSYSEIMTVAATGQRTIFHHPGANAHLDARDFDFTKTHAKILHLAFLALLDRMDRPHHRYGTVAAQVLARAQTAGLVTSADVVSDGSGRLPALAAAALPHLDYFFFNETEAELLTSARVRAKGGGLDRTRLLHATTWAVERGLRGWAVCHTAEGALAHRAGSASIWQPSVRLPSARIVGSNGAGDAFAAGFLHAVHEAQPVSEALRVAACVAAASLTSGTASEGVPTLARCLALGRSYGFR
jgi:sugar/nucleoside kinase (ribokinase family)